MDLQEVHRNIYLKIEKRHPFHKEWFYKNLVVGFTEFGVQMIFLWICKVDKYEEMAHYWVGTESFNKNVHKLSYGLRSI